jgi:uncharacterized protein YggE
MKKSILLALAFLFCLGAKTQNQDGINNKRFIEVTGTDETEITPDELFLTITLQESKERPAIQKQEEELKQSIKELGIDLSNLTLNSANADYGKVRLMKKDVQVSKSYILKISNAEMIGKVYEKLDKINAQDAYISRVDHSKMTEIKKESRIKAIKAAREKVDYLLAAVGQQAGQPIQITEVENYIQNFVPNVIMAKRATFAAESMDDNQEISFKKIKLKTSFLVRYEIISK